MTCDHEAQIRDLLEEREELLTEIVRLQRGNHPAGWALRLKAEAWDEGFERGALEQGTGQGLALVANPYRDATCLHCGHVGAVEDDHSCPCPYSDAECPNHGLALAEALTERDAEHEGGGE